MERTTIDLEGPVSVIEYGGTGPLMVCVHGLEGSAYNWRLVADHLTKRFTVVAPDLRGFGYTEPGPHPVTVDHNADLVASLVERFGGPAIVVGNSMGGLVSILTAARHADAVRGLVLIDPAGPVARWSRVDPARALTLAAPLLPGGTRIVEAYRNSRTPEEGVRESYAFVAAHPERVNEDALGDAIEIAELRRTQPWSASTLVHATRSIAPYVLTKHRFRTVLHRVHQPTLLMHGTEDGVIQPQTASWIASERPDWTTVYLEDLAHVAMIEDPDRFVAVVDTWLDATFDD
ncbi:MAG: alpha/beta hydrolase [Acidimicrobiia bacterium]|nr:alpha/beta hydrolase [Acidimicrobiia bacterium]